MRTQRRTGYIGQIVDGIKLAEICNAIYKIQYNSEGKHCTVSNLLFITLKDETDFGDKRYALVCNEGVGWEQDSYSSIKVPTNFGAMNLYNGSVAVGINVIKECLTDETADLSEYIRTFGARLDDNCAIWQNQMSVPSDMILV